MRYKFRSNRLIALNFHIHLGQDRLAGRSLGDLFLAWRGPGESVRHAIRPGSIRRSSPRMNGWTMFAVATAIVFVALLAVVFVGTETIRRDRHDENAGQTRADTRAHTR